MRSAEHAQRISEWKLCDELWRCTDEEGQYWYLVADISSIRLFNSILNISFISRGNFQLLKANDKSSPDLRQTVGSLTVAVAS